MARGELCPAQASRGSILLFPADGRLGPEGGEVASGRGELRGAETTPDCAQLGLSCQKPPLVINTRPAEFLMNRTIRLCRGEVATRLGPQIIRTGFRERRRCISYASDRYLIEKNAKRSGQLIPIVI